MHTFSKRIPSRSLVGLFRLFWGQNEELRGVVVTRLLEEMFGLVGLPMLPPPPQLVLAMPRPNDILPSRFVCVCFVVCRHRPS